MAKSSHAEQIHKCVNQCGTGYLSRLVLRLEWWSAQRVNMQEFLHGCL